MSNQEILLKAIEKAIESGYIPDVIDNITNIKPTIRNGQAWVRFFNNEGQEVIQDLEHVIYAHSFAKALWPDPDGEDEPHEINDNQESAYPGVYYWQHHLQQMVIADDPLKYLENNI